MTDCDAVARFCAASAANDLDGMVSTLTLDAELISPISGRMVFRGRDDLRVLLAAVYGSTIRNLRWHDRVGTGDLQVVLSDGMIGPLSLTDAMVFEIADDGLIQRLRPHLRPWLALTLVALKLGPKMGLHAGVVRRALASTPSIAIDSGKMHYRGRCLTVFRLMLDGYFG
jgi:hypothetical protein